MINKFLERLNELNEWITWHPGQLLIAWIILYPTLLVGLAWAWARI